MNCSEDMKRQRYKAKKSQWFRRMFTVALLMGGFDWLPDG